MSVEFEQAIRLADRGDWSDLIELLNRSPQLATETDDGGATLLIRLARFGGSESALQELMSLGANPNHRAFDGSNALASAIIGGSTYGLTTLPALETLIKGGADPNTVADAGMPALHWSIAQNRLDHARVLLERGANPDELTSDSPPETAQQIALRLRSDRALQLLKMVPKK